MVPAERDIELGEIQAENLSDSDDDEQAVGDNGGYDGDDVIVYQKFKNFHLKF
uniref:Uncharacterized protein n=1 Tax=Meloidogyne enterolobii TaxID=390850 RepID=A0A6V7WY40_MELEN|nr:unnamed protein product [Meloidogyne enterolobii]